MDHRGAPGRLRDWRVAAAGITADERSQDTAAAPGADIVRALRADPAAASRGTWAARLLAERAPGDLELQVAGLVHPLGPAGVGLALGGRVAELLALLVPAARFLAAVDVTYRQRLGRRAAAEIEAAGGPFDRAGVSAFVAGARWREAVALRRAVEAAERDVERRHKPGGGRHRTTDDDGIADWTAALDEVARRHRHRRREPA